MIGRIGSSGGFSCFTSFNGSTEKSGIAFSSKEKYSEDNSVEISGIMIVVLF
jgi:hypothetical protein